MTTLIEERHPCWNVEGWVNAALRHWADRNGHVQIVRHTTAEGSWIDIMVEGEKVATVTVQKPPSGRPPAPSARPQPPGP